MMQFIAAGMQAALHSCSHVLSWQQGAGCQGQCRVEGPSSHGSGKQLVVAVCSVDGCNFVWIDVLVFDGLLVLQLKVCLLRLFTVWVKIKITLQQVRSAPWGQRSPDYPVQVHGEGQLSTIRQLSLAGVEVLKMSSWWDTFV
jgi:hypothetical protein